jgi:hypothetical protein
MNVFAGHLRDAPAPPSTRLGRPVPDDLESLVLAALSKDPADRPGSARAFREALASCRGIPAWTDAEAAAWWRGRGRELRRPKAAVRAGSSSRTLLVDLAAKR